MPSVRWQMRMLDHAIIVSGYGVWTCWAYGFAWYCWWFDLDVALPGFVPMIIKHRIELPRIGCAVSVMNGASGWFKRFLVIPLASLSPTMELSFKGSPLSPPKVFLVLCLDVVSREPGQHVVSFYRALPLPDFIYHFYVLSINSFVFCL